MGYLEEPKEKYGEPKVHQLGFTGIWIPAEIVMNDKISWTEKCIYAYIHALSKSPKGCFASNQYFSKVFGISKSSISKYISSLKKLGLVKESQFNGRYRKLDVTVKYYKPE